MIRGNGVHYIVQCNTIVYIFFGVLNREKLLSLQRVSSNQVRRKWNFLENNMYCMSTRYFCLKAFYFYCKIRLFCYSAGEAQVIGAIVEEQTAKYRWLHYISCM